MSCTVCGVQATIYCKNDEARLCAGCDVQIHQQNPLAACHKRVPFVACSLCNNQAVVYCHNDQANLCAACDSSVHASLPFKHHRVPLEQGAEACAPIDASNPSAQAPAIPPAVELPLNTIMDKDSLAKSLWGQDMQGFDMDSSWLDRLDMGFDFSDILDEPSDGLVPTLSPTAAEAAAAAFMAPASLPNELALPACSPPLMEVGLMMAVPQAPAAKAESHMQHEDLLAPMMVPQMMPPPPPTAVPVSALAAVPRPPPPAPQPTSSSALSLASSSTRANTRAAAAAACGGDSSLHRALSIPNSEHLTREQRVARYLEKRKNRKFQKTIRYASRKAYAEVRPRIKGRFAKREEVQAWRVAEAAMAANAPAGFHMAAGNDMTVPVM